MDGNVRGEGATCEARVRAASSTLRRALGDAPDGKMVEIGNMQDERCTRLSQRAQDYIGDWVRGLRRERREFLGSSKIQALQARVDSLEEEIDEAKSTIRRYKEFVMNRIRNNDPARTTVVNCSRPEVQEDRINSGGRMRTLDFIASKRMKVPCARASGPSPSWDDGQSTEHPGRNAGRPEFPGTDR